MGSEDPSLTRRLRVLGSQMMQVAAEISRRGAPPQGRAVLAALELDSDLWLLAAKEMYQDRLRRRAHFSPGLFGEPAWDMLLDLYIAEKEGRQIAVTSACLGAQVPVTTALRWLQQLEAEGLVVRDQDQSDGRRRLVRISDQGYARMTAYIAEQRQDWLNAELSWQPVAPAPDGALKERLSSHMAARGSSFAAN